MATTNSNNTNGKVSKASLPWGHKILREKAIELYKKGTVAPSAVFANLLIASASQVLDTDLLIGQPRAMSDAVNKIIADALQKARMPNADLVKIFDEVIALSWVSKKSQEQPLAKVNAVKHGSLKNNAKKLTEKKTEKPKSSTNTNVKSVKKVSTIVVRKTNKLSGNN